MIQIEPNLAWAMVTTIAGVAFALGGGVFFVKRLDTDLRRHMREESEWRENHVQHGGHSA